MGADQRAQCRERCYAELQSNCCHLPQLFPHIVELALERMELSQQALACIAGLTQLTTLRLRCGARLADWLACLMLQEACRVSDLCLIADSHPELHPSL